MAEEQKQAPADDIEAMKKELAEIKSEMMKKELEDIKREKMLKELEEMKAENKQKQEQQAPPQKPSGKVKYVIPPYEGKLSAFNVFVASACLLAAGYLACTLYSYNIEAEITKLIAGFQAPISGTEIVVIATGVLVFVGVGMVTIARQ
jgi:hypothetical protein